MSDEHEDGAEEPPIDAAMVGTTASLDPSGTTLAATVVAGAVGALVGAGRRVVGAFRPQRRRDEDGPGRPT